MNRAQADRAIRLRDTIRQQRQWIDQCGGNLFGYVMRYGDSSADPTKRVGEGGRYGMGGQAIYEADVDALRQYEAEYEALTGHRY